MGLLSDLNSLWLYKILIDVNDSEHTFVERMKYNITIIDF